MITESRHTSALTRCLQLNALALTFSLMHTIGDYGIVTIDLGEEAPALWAFLAVAGIVYGWWGWSLAQAARGGRAGLPSLIALSGFWAVLNGATFPFTSLTNLPADVIHFGSLLFGVWAAYATGQLMRNNHTASIRTVDKHA